MLVSGLSRAFDTLNHSILLKKLNNYGIRGTANMWFENYLNNRSLVAKVTTSPNKTVKSERFDITYGTAQGSCLGPLLFILFVNDIHHLPIYSKLILFAMIQQSLIVIHATNTCSFMLEHDLNLMTDWFNANKLSLNLHKTAAMQFWNNKTSLELRVDNIKIPVVESTKFLGVQIDNQLTWHNHANRLSNKLSINKRLMAKIKMFSGTTLLYFVYWHYNIFEYNVES